MLLFQQNLQTTSQAFTLTASVGSFNVSGQDAQITVGLTLIAQNSSFSLNGQNVGVSVSYKLATNVGEFVLNGQTAQITAHRSLVSDYGQFVLNGQDVTISKDGAVGFSILAEFGQVTLLGNSVQITKTSQPTTGGAVKRKQPVFTPPNYREQILKEDEMFLTFVNEIIIGVKI
jgi:hypothetical protein